MTFNKIMSLQHIMKHKLQCYVENGLKKRFGLITRNGANLGDKTCLWNHQN